MSLAIAVPAHGFTAAHTVTFFENTSSSDPVTALQTANSTQPLTLIQNLSPSFSDAGSSFSGWNTSASGDGVAYADGSAYSFTADIGLYAQWIPIPIVHTVTFFENATPSDSLTAIQIGSSAQSLTLLQNMSPAFSNLGYTFVGWNSSANGTGIPYADGATYSFGADFGLYAQWALIPIVHTVTFFENSSAQDAVDAQMSASAPTPLTTFTNLDPSFSDPGLSFSGWNTKSDGSGTSYENGSTYSFNADIGLYAQWVAIVVSHTVTFSENDNSSDSVVSFATNSSITPLTSFANLLPTFDNPGHVFTGWNTSAAGDGVAYVDGEDYSFAANMVLYAQWAAVETVHTVTFNENDSSSDLVDSIMSESSATPLTLFANLTPAFVNVSHSFTGWNTAADGDGISYPDGYLFSFNSSLELYAQWSSIALDTFSFNVNGGSGTLTPISVAPGQTVLIPGQSGMIRAGFVLTKWSTNADGSGSTYEIGEVVTATQSQLLFAQWSGHKPATLFGAIGTFKSGSSSLSQALKSQINRVALTIKLRKYLKIDLFGYSAATGLKSLNISLSRDRAETVATYLRLRLRLLKVRGVIVSSSGQGAIAGQSSNEYSRVEVFGV